MTTNQIRFAELKENIRHNLVSEGWTGSGIQENVRHNMQVEDISWFGNETSRKVGLGQVANSAQANTIQATAVTNLGKYQQGQLENQSIANQNLKDFQLGQLANSKESNAIARDRQLVDASLGWMMTTSQVDLNKSNEKLSRSRVVNETIKTGIDSAAKVFSPFATPN